jgi:hypothetical protein
VTETHSGVAETQPGVADTQLGVAETQPRLAESRSEVTETYPGVAEAQPGVVSISACYVSHNPASSLSNKYGGSKYSEVGTERTKAQFWLGSHLEQSRLSSALCGG